MKKSKSQESDPQYDVSMGNSLDPWIKKEKSDIKVEVTDDDEFIRLHKEYDL